MSKILNSFNWFLFALIILVSLILMLGAARTDSAIMDELAHIPAGYGYINNLDYRLNPEHPPLVKALGALPVKILINPNFPTGSSFWTKDVNGQWAMGNQFLYESGNNADKIISLFRLGPILLTLLLIYLIYFWAKKLFGKWWGLLPAFLFGLSPNVLAHGHYITTDVAAALGIVLGTYYFLNFLFNPSKKNLFFAGLAFGVSQITKFSAVLLIPYFIILISVFYIASVIHDLPGTLPGKKLKRFFVRGVRYFRATLIIFAIGYLLIVYPIYALFTWNYPVQKQVGDTQFILNSFANGPTPPGKLCQPVRCLADLDIWAAKSKILRPFAQYLLGVLMVLQRSAGGNTAYFLGDVGGGGWWYYFPVVYLLKEPLPILILVLFALFYSAYRVLKAIFKRQNKFLEYLKSHFSEFSMIVFIVFYWAYSINAKLNIGFRHLFPTLPFIYMLTTGVLKRYLSPQNPIAFKISVLFENFLKIALKYFILGLILVWVFFAAVTSYPYFLSYFNEFGGGVLNGYKFVDDSNYDWGQDLIRLKNFVTNHPEIDRIAVDYFGGGNPKYYLGDKEVNWWSALGNPAEKKIHYLAVSINTLEQARAEPAQGAVKNYQDSYWWLENLRPSKPGMGEIPEPDFRIGTSIFVYKL